MRVVIFAAGTQGDARPNAALGQALQLAGHDVTLITSRDFEALAEMAGIGFAPISADFRAMMEADRERIDGRSQVAIAMHGLRRLREMASHWVGESLEVTRGAGLVIGSGPLLYLAASVAEALDVPFVRTMLQPIEPAREFPPVLMRPPRFGLPGRVNLTLHGLVRNATWQLGRGAMTRVRRELGLAPYPLSGPWRSARAGMAPLLNGFSATIVPPSLDWGPHIATTGFWSLRNTGPALPARVEAFLEAGPAPIYVGFGSMISKDAAGLAVLVRDAIARSGRRAIIAGGWGALADMRDSDTVLAVDDVAHERLLPRVALAVHHCGAGTTAAVASAGIPSVPVPFLLDQFFWAERLHALGIGTAPLRRGRMSAGDLAGAIASAGEAGIVAASARIGARLRAEDGTGNALAQLAEWGLISPLVAAAGPATQG